MTMYRSTESILIVGEDQPLLRALAFTLKRHEFAVTSSSDPRGVPASLDGARKRGTPYSLLIIDIRLPGHEELQLIDLLGNQSAAMPVLVITSSRCPDLAGPLERLRIRGVLTKPYNSEELLRHVASLLEERPGAGRSERASSDASTGMD
jgi:DNA-binding NtrC family response regulator